MPFQIVRNDITKVKADAVVNTANPRPEIGGGTDSAIYRAAGEELLLAERMKIGDIAPGEAAVTKAFNLCAEYVIHTVGPVWIDGKHGEVETLRACYSNSLEKARLMECGSVAFPLIATGTYGFPKDEALRVALSEISSFLLSHDMLVILVVFDDASFELSGRLISGIDEYIDNVYAENKAKEEYGGRNIRRERAPVSSRTRQVPAVSALEDAVLGVGETFSERLLSLIRESGRTEVSVYKRANIDRKVFSRIRCKKDYRPEKKTALAFAIALELDLSMMQDLLSRAGYALSPSNRSDIIVSYFVRKGIYDIFEINAALFRYGEPILGE